MANPQPKLKEVATRQAVPLNQTRIKEAAYVRNSWFATTPPETKIEDLLKPEYWRNCSFQLKPNDKIEVVTEDGQWYVELIVINASRVWAKVHILNHIDLRAAKEDMPLTDDEAHEVKYMGPVAKHAVLHKADGIVLKDGFQTQLEGWQWLESHLKSM